MQCQSQAHHLKAERHRNKWKPVHGSQHAHTRGYKKWKDFREGLMRRALANSAVSCKLPNPAVMEGPLTEVHVTRAISR